MNAFSDPPFTGIELPRCDKKRGRIVIVDDDNLNRTLLGAQLSKDNFTVLEASNGKQAVQVCETAIPDIILMDILMPEMDGYETTRFIRKHWPDTFVPILFITSQADESALAECIHAGGDDFLCKPYTPIILKARIKALERMRDQSRQIQWLLGQRLREDELAIQTFKAIKNNVASDSIQTIMKSADQFNGDVFLTAYTPNNDLHALLGDLTGHGLSAALGALPVSDIFYVMTKKGFSAKEILEEINRKLYKLLPANMFMAAQFVTVNSNIDQLSLVNCGMPAILHVRGNPCTVINRVHSSTYPLGVTPELNVDIDIQYNALQYGDRIVLMSDGILEARNEANEMFNDQRIESAISSARHVDDILHNLEQSVHQFMGHNKLINDMSLVVIPCTTDVIPKHDVPVSDSHSFFRHTPMPHREAFNFRIRYEGRQLAKAYPQPLIIDVIKRTIDIGSHAQSLFTIISELYNNALDHGVLCLDSSLKQDPCGFGNYLSERDQRLQALKEGVVSIEITVLAKDKFYEATMEVIDSGTGFDFVTVQAFDAGESHLHGRGIALLKGLCRSLEFKGKGNHAIAVYDWQDT